MNFFNFKFFIKFLLLLFFSWLLIHAMALMGIFVSLAYPFWWLFSQKKNSCFICKIKKIRSCNFGHACSAGALLLVFSILSVGLVLIEKKALLTMGFPATPKEASFIIPAKGQHYLGEIFPLKIEIDGIKTPINAVQTDLSFDPNQLEIVSISTENSFASIFIQKEIDNEAGYARLTGGLPNPGFFGDKGFFGTVFFKSKSLGVVKIEFLPSSIVLANDGKGTNVLKDLGSISYIILSEERSSLDLKRQKNKIAESAILGKSTERGTQMIFFDENQVLGSNIDSVLIENNINQATKKNRSYFLENFLGMLQKIDEFILKTNYSIPTLFYFAP